MQFSKNWLKEFVDINLSTKDLCDQLTMAGLEVDGFEDFHSKLTGKDSIIKLDITPNRGDCFSILGVAREVAVLNNLALKIKTPRIIKPTIPRKININICDESPRYVGRLIEGIEIASKTDSLIAERLQTSDLRLIDPVVDITNYILLELGQPLHAFDYDKLEGDITVRFSKKNENICLLDNTKIKLNKDCMVIADQKEPIAFAGIMGGLSTAVSKKTKSIFLESAFFKPEIIRGKARKYGLQTDASMRFERGVDFQIQELAIERASMLLQEVVGGNFGPIQNVSKDSCLPKNPIIKLNLDKANTLLGSNISSTKAKKYLTGLGLKPKNSDKKFTLVSPSWRYDLTIEEDLVEELARLEGYDNLPKETLKPISRKNKTPKEPSIPALLKSMGYDEVITYSFIDQSHANLITEKSLAVVKNPISQNMTTMRPSLWPGLISTYINNDNHGKPDQKIYEQGSTFIEKRDGSIQEEKNISGLIAGNDQSVHWNTTEKAFDFYDLKGDLQNIFQAYGLAVSYEETDNNFLHPGKSACIKAGTKKIGYLGSIHPNVISAYDLKEEVLVFSILLNNLNLNKKIKFSRYSKYPSTSRDLSFIVDENISSSLLISMMKPLCGKDVIDLMVFDVYSGKGVQEGKKSMAFSLKWQSQNKTLVDEEIDKFINDVVDFLSKEIGAELRSK